MFVKARAVSSALIFKVELNGFLFRYSTAAPTHFLVNYLINSLGFSNDEAISASAKVGYRVSTSKKPDLTVNFLKQTGFNDTQIKILVSKFPEVLFCDVEKNLKPKFRCLSQLGLSDSDLVKFILRDWASLQRGLDTRIKPLINSLKILLGSDEDVVKVIKKCSWLISYSGGKTIQDSLNVLQAFGCPDDKIKNIVLRNPVILKHNTKKLEEMLHRVEKEFGISPGSTVFLHTVNVLSSMRQEMLDKKFGIFKSFGWSDYDILQMLRSLPECMGLSEVRIQQKLNFFMKELGFGPAFLASHPAILGYSLEKRVVPRMQVLKILDEKKVERRLWHLYCVVSLSETKFIKCFVQPYKDQIPDLYEPLKKAVA